MGGRSEAAGPHDVDPPLRVEGTDQIGSLLVNVAMEADADVRLEQPAQESVSLDLLIARDGVMPDSQSKDLCALLERSPRLGRVQLPVGGVEPTRERLLADAGALGEVLIDLPRRVHGQELESRLS